MRYSSVGNGEDRRGSREEDFLLIKVKSIMGKIIEKVAFVISQALLAVAMPIVLAVALTFIDSGDVNMPLLILGAVLTGIGLLIAIILFVKDIIRRRWRIRNTKT